MRDIAIIALLKGIPQTAAKFGYDEDQIKTSIGNLSDDPFFVAIRKLIWDCLCKSGIDVTSTTFKLSLNSLQIFKKYYEANMEKDEGMKEGEENTIDEEEAEERKKFEGNIAESIENADIEMGDTGEKKETKENSAWFEEEEDFNNLESNQNDKVEMEKMDIEKLGEALDEVDSDYE